MQKKSLELILQLLLLNPTPSSDTQLRGRVVQGVTGGFGALGSASYNRVYVST